jgi:hypothetical protein
MHDDIKKGKIRIIIRVLLDDIIAICRAYNQILALLQSQKFNWLIINLQNTKNILQRSQK